ncbi:histone-like nucleoid-structuring protein, MvaT/MvaU family [Pseudomonas oryzihabitans]|uniref:histone-like nucleoid-structuring protein, MvaT/MvaU family n=1 Tax=Pseudomonas oryzihabitans TaxID=47885 RepID=UPI00123872B2|nr:histone-like nucleoid-structuring protein, MvaT/MvaU family [Pseudomonas oryzihabitans]QEU01827.1 transcriptional regulator [Pseudomonas oryzihabitans]
MSLIQEYRQTEAAIEELKQRLEQLNSDERLQKELEFEKKLRALLGEHSKSLRDVIAILDPDSSTNSGRKNSSPAVPQQRRARTLKRYKHPETGEVIETKGGNHKLLKAWKSEHGANTVESWLQGE